jgi:cell division protein FtsB
MTFATSFLTTTVFAYLNRVHSSRRLARECRRNLEAIWLVEGLAPGYRTIAEFRKLNGKALKAACKDFVALCKELDLLGGEVVAIDGAFFNASASDASVVTKTRLEKDLKQIEVDIDAYCRDLDAHDQQERDGTADLGTASDLEAKLDKLKARQARKQAQIKQLQDSGETQLSRTDPDARALRKAGQKTTGYNVQNTVDAKHKIIVDHEVTNAGNDAEQLAAQAIAAKAALEVDNLIAVADAGYYSERQLADCAAANITAYVGIPDKHQTVRAQGRFSGAQFQYVGGADVYVCLGGEVLRPQGKPAPIHGILRRRYTRPAKACQGCPLKGICLPESGAGRQIYRSEHAAVAEIHGQRMAEQGRERMAQRASLVEHPFGTLKRWFGWDHFLVRGFEKVRGEMSLMVLGYNLIRVINILGLAALRDYCAQRLPRGQTATQAEVAA